LRYVALAVAGFGLGTVCFGPSAYVVFCKT
jgi:hypothetical protein